MSQTPSLSARQLLEAAALRFPVAAASPLGLVEAILAPGADPEPGDPGIPELGRRREAWLAAPGPLDGPAALRRLLAEDLGTLLGRFEELASTIAAWHDPKGALTRARDRMLEELARLGLDLDPPALHVVETLPRTYDVPSLHAVSLDRCDGAQLGLPPGVYLRRPRLAPFRSETVLGHVLVHVALGARSPELLGRGLEEGLAEVVGALHAASGAIGAEAVEAVFRATRLSWPPGPYRPAFLDQVRRAALLGRRHGLVGLIALIDSGRGAVKRAEAALGAGEIERVPLAPAACPPDLGPRLERLLEARGAPLVVSPQAFLLARHLRAGQDPVPVGRELGIPSDQARSAARELADRVFVLVRDATGRVLADDLSLLCEAGMLRYEIPLGRPAAASRQTWTTHR